MQSERVERDERSPAETREPEGFEGVVPNPKLRLMDEVREVLHPNSNR
jgi:hypothetical protein